MDDKKPTSRQDAILVNRNDPSGVEDLQGQHLGMTHREHIEKHPGRKNNKKRRNKPKPVPTRTT